MNDRNFLIKRGSAKHLPIAVVLPAVLTFGLFVVVFFSIILPSFKNSLQDRKKESLQMLVDSGSSICRHFWMLEKSGVLSRKAAQESAVSVLKSMRYGPNQKDYFWISDLHPNLVMHPYREELENKDVSSLVDAEGKLVFVAFAEIAGKQGSGFSNYLWQWQDVPNRIESKLSYVKLFKPWGWVIGSGFYLEDVNREIGRLSAEVTRAVVGIMVTIALLLSVIVVTGIQNNKRRESAVAALGVSEEKFRALTENAVDGIVRLDQNLRILYANPAMVRLTAAPLEALIEKPLDERILPSPVAAQWKEAVASVYATKQMKRIVFMLPSEVWMDCFFVPETNEEQTVKAVIGIARDITNIRLAEQEKVLLERQLHQSQKMDALGTLAGGIAHDFNNKLAVIRGHAEMALEEIDEAHEIREDLLKIIEAAVRSKDLVSQILDFSRRKESVKNVVDVVPIFRESVNMLRASMPSTIALDLDLPEHSIWITANATQLQQVVINLGSNAAHAMRDQHGKLKIVASVVTLAKADVTANPDLGPGKYLRFVMRDNGCGISDFLLDRIFEPFFTTKPPREGTGLGLAVVHGIVRAHGGAIEVESETGQGTAFTIYFPIAVDFAKAEKSRPTEVVGGSESLLIVDDEPEILSVAAKMLGRLGYRVRTARDGIEALELLTKEPGDIDLVITDETMPRLTGIRLAEELHERLPTVPLILCTGYPDRLDPPALLEIGIKNILTKPYSKGELCRAIRGILDSESRKAET